MTSGQYRPCLAMLVLVIMCVGCRNEPEKLASSDQEPQPESSAPRSVIERGEPEFRFVLLVKTPPPSISDAVTGVFGCRCGLVS